MNRASQLFSLHSRKIIALILLAQLQVIFSLGSGSMKARRDIDFLDVFGEGGAVMLSLGWLIVLSCSRPAGRVSSLLIGGLGCFFIALWQDFLDEFIAIPSHYVWPGWVESLPMPFGFALLTVGFCYWHREQLVLNDGMLKRERHSRDHRLVDSNTRLSGVSYLKERLGYELDNIDKSDQPLSLLMIGVDDFDSLNRQWGFHEGDRYLQDLSSLILLNLRRCDVLCHYAGDRFAVVMPATGGHQAQRAADQLASSVQHFAFKTITGETVFRTVSAGVVTTAKGDSDSLIEEAGKQLLATKDRRIKPLQVLDQCDCYGYRTLA